MKMRKDWLKSADATTNNYDANSVDALRQIDDRWMWARATVQVTVQPYMIVCIAR